MQGLFDLLAVPILSIVTGKQIGEVEEVLLKIDTALIYGIIVKDAAWFSEKRFIHFADIHRIGPDAVMIDGAHLLHAVEQDVMDREQIYALNQLTGKSIFTEAGLNIGLLADITFDHVTGELKAYKVSDGTITDLLYGRLNLPLPHVQVVCDDRIIIPESMTKLLHTE